MTHNVAMLSDGNDDDNDNPLISLCVYIYVYVCVCVCVCVELFLALSNGLTPPMTISYGYFKNGYCCVL